jgi:predicted small secreted protein
MKALKLTCIAFAVMALSACGTVNGFGQDVTAAGKDIQKISTPGEKKENK